MKFFRHSWAKHLHTFFYFLAQCPFTTSKTELVYYHHRMNVSVASWVAEGLKTEDFSKLGNFNKIPEILGFDGKNPAVHPKAKFWRFFVKNRKKSAVKEFTEQLFCLISWVCLQPFVQDCTNYDFSWQNLFKDCRVLKYIWNN